MNGEEETDVFYHLSDIMREPDCREYVRLFQLRQDGDKAYTQIFHEELERLNLDTFKNLKGFNLKGDRKAQLIDIVRKARKNRTPFDQIKEFTHGTSDKKDVDSTVMKTSKKIFFDIFMWGAKAVSVINNPLYTLAGACAGFKYANINTFVDVLDEVTPNRESFSESTGLMQGIRQFAVSLTCNRSPFCKV